MAPASPRADDLDPRLATIEQDLPAGLLDLAAAHWRRAEADADRAGLAPASLGERDLRSRLSAELTAPLRLEDWPGPVEPRTVAGGWLHVEVLDDELDVLDAVLADRVGDGPDRLAAAAQELRLPVSPYRPLGPARSTPAHPLPVADRSPDGARSAPPVVVDLTTHWAGPLTTALLAEWGAEVIKVDPSCRPDGFRARPALYDHLNGDKAIVDLDLRRPNDRSRFEALLTGADLLVESFSRRVLPNLGYGPDDLDRLNPNLAILAIRAFPAASPEADWLAYGPGVHAASGLGLVSSTPRPAPVAYPDLVAGVLAATTAVEMLAAGTGARAEVSLAGAIEPLVDRARTAAGASVGVGLGVGGAARG